MLDLVTFALSLTSVSVLASVLWVYLSFRKSKTIPGLVATSKQDGNLGDVGRAGCLHNFLVDLHGKFGPIAGFWWDTTYVVSIASPQLLKEQRDVFDRPPKLFKWLEPMVGASSMQFANGDEGKYRRRNYDRAFAQKLLHLYCPYFQKVADSISDKLSEVGPDDHVPLTEHIYDYSLRCALGALIGKKLKGEDVLSQFKVAHDIAWNELDRRQIKRIIRESDVKTPEEKQFYDALKVLEHIIKDAVGDRRKRSGEKLGNKLIDIFIEICPTEEAIINEVITYAIGAFHTASSALTWAFYYLATHKEVQDKVYKEIKEVLGDDGIVNEANFPKLTYLMQVMNETNRLAIISPITARVSDDECEIGGYKIPQKTPVIQALGIVLHDETIWPSPQKFDPDRFSKENMKNKSQYCNPAFGFSGKRQCPGYKFVFWEEAVLITSLLRRFEIRLAFDQKAQYARGMVTHSKEEIWLKITKRQ